MALHNFALIAGTLSSLGAFLAAAPEPAANYVAATLLFTAGMFYITAAAMWGVEM